MTLLKKRKTSIPAIAAIIIIAMTIIGFSYAHWEKFMWISGDVSTGYLCAEFVPRISGVDDGVDWTCGSHFANPLPGPRADGKNISNTVITVLDTDHDGCNDTVNVLLNNTYPCYYNEITVHVHNCGPIPWSIISVNFSTPYGYRLVTTAPYYFTLDLNHDGKADVEINYGDGLHTQVDYCGTLEISFEIHVLQDAPQDTLMGFHVTFKMVNWNEDPQCIVPEPEL